MADEGAKHRLERFYAVAAARIAELDADPNPKLTPLRDVMGHERYDALKAAEALNPTSDEGLFE